jgi:hypothetical protein
MAHRGVKPTPMPWEYRIWLGIAAALAVLSFFV